MHYFIDGYNLLFRMLHSGKNLQTEREEFVEDLAEKIHLLELDATIVFDSNYQAGDRMSSHLKDLKVVFTAAGESADEYILKELKESSSPQNHIVVTSDKKLSWLCRRRLAKTEDAAEFLQLLNKRYRNKLRPKKKSAPASIPDIKTPEMPPSAPPPRKPLTPEASFDFYLEAFESRYRELQAKPPAAPKKKKRKFLAKPPPEDPLVADMDRWLEAFQKRLLEDEH